MNNNIKIHDNIVHIWRLYLPDFTQDTANLAKLLSPDELHRAERFHFPIHQERFIITRGLLRKTLNLYTTIASDALIFHYGEHGKPCLANNDFDLRFNVSHSHDMAVFAFTVHKEIGIDIEKIELSFKDSVAKRFFSPAEYQELVQLPETEQVIAFYKIWSRKEALIKALGKGLYTPLDSFTVSSQKDTQTVLCNDEHYLVKHIPMNADFQTAFATVEPVTDVIEWQWIENKPMRID
jgi:4'-phosphopantetheinyl transferase